MQNEFDYLRRLGSRLLSEAIWIVKSVLPHGRWPDR
jgi:hypothetical protein